ncbi:MAG: DUF1659 domain-containing protein [Epulopiscium sp.]|nr:DUF1659 domain-containing protein [Candidatus Epulonipiscium sp.]
MAIATNPLKTKLQLKYEKGSKTFSNCRHDVTDQDLFDVGEAINGLQEKPAEQIVKVVESQLVQE